MSEIPKEWQKIGRWEAHVAWLKNQPTQMPMWMLDDEDFDDDDLDDEDLDDEQVSELEDKVESEAKPEIQAHRYPEDQLHPGWWFYHGVGQSELYTDYAKALDHITKVLKRPEVGAHAGLHLSKSQRKAHIQAFHAKFAEPFFTLEERDLLWEYGDWALKASLSYSAFREILECSFEEAINPVRSLEGLRVRLEKREYGEDNTELVAEGVLHVENNTVELDQWSHTFEPDDGVEGEAYATSVSNGIAVFSDSEQFTFFFYLEEEPQ